MNIEITIPSDLSDIKLWQYQKYLKVAEQNDDDGEFLKQKMIEIFCNVKLQDVANMKFKDVEEICNHIGSLFTDKYKLIQTFKFKGLKFGFIPNLDDMTNGEYVDLDTYVTDWQEMHKACAVLFRPVIQELKGKYIIEDYKGSDKYSDAMRDLPLDIAMGAVVFFWDLGNVLLNSTMDYLEEEMEKPTIQSQLNSVIGGDGTRAFMHSLREMLGDLKISAN